MCRHHVVQVQQAAKSLKHLYHRFNAATGLKHLHPELTATFPPFIHVNVMFKKLSTIDDARARDVFQLSPVARLWRPFIPAVMMMMTMKSMTENIKESLLIFHLQSLKTRCLELCSVLNTEVRFYHNKTDSVHSCCLIIVVNVLE